MGKDINERLDDIEIMLKDVHKLARDLRVRVYEYLDKANR